LHAIFFFGTYPPLRLRKLFGRAAIIQRRNRPTANFLVPRAQ
jgi:hypothetical protein